MLPKTTTLGELVGGAGCVGGGRKKSGRGVFWTTSALSVSTPASGRLHGRGRMLLVLLLLLLTFSVSVANPKKLLHTVANPARGLLNREKGTKGKFWQRNPPRSRPYRIPPARRLGRFVSLRRFYASVCDDNFLPSLVAQDGSKGRNVSWRNGSLQKNQGWTTARSMPEYSGKDIREDSPKLACSCSCTRRYFQHAHLKPIVGVGKRGAC